LQYVQTLAYLAWYKILGILRPRKKIKQKVDEESADEELPP